MKLFITKLLNKDLFLELKYTTEKNIFKHRNSVISLRLINKEDFFHLIYRKI